jgi:hypothetical protein
VLARTSSSLPDQLTDIYELKTHRCLGKNKNMVMGPETKMTVLAEASSKLLLWTGICLHPPNKFFKKSKRKSPNY